MLEAHGDWDGSRKREAAVTNEDSLVAAWRKRWHALPASQARRGTASCLACHLRATAVRGDYHDGEPVHTGLDDERPGPAIRREGGLGRELVVRDHHRVAWPAPAIEVDRGMASVSHNQRALDGSARRDPCLLQDEPVC